MTRRIIILCVAFCVMCSAALAQDSHCQLNIGMHHEETEKTASLDLIIEGEEAFLLSELFPSYKVKVGNVAPENLNAVLEYPSAMMMHTPESVRTAMDEWTAGLDTEKTEGLFAGDLFDEAVDVRKGICSQKELLSLLEKVFPFFLGISAIHDQTYRSETEGFSVQFGIYDSGKYYSFTGMDKEKTLFTASVDFSEDNRIGLLFGYPENACNYYWKIILQFQLPEQISVQSSFYSDPEQNGFRYTDSGTPVLSGNWMLTADEIRDQVSFKGELLPQNDLNPIEVNGSITKDADQFFYAEMRFRDFNDSWLFASMKTDHQIPDAKELKEISLSEIDDQFRTELAGTILSLSPFFVLAVPADYIVKLLSAE